MIKLAQLNTTDLLLVKLLVLNEALKICSWQVKSLIFQKMGSKDSLSNIPNANV